MAARFILASALALLLAPSAAIGQELAIPPVRYPALPATATNAEGFAPPGWRVEIQATGDLDADRTADLAFVLRMQDPANVLTNQSAGGAAFDTNPRILAVARGVRGAGFRLALQDHLLIPRRETPNAEDYFGADGVLGGGELQITRGALRVGIVLFMNAGGWESGRTTFTFRLRDGALWLIGFDRDTTHRGSGDTTKVSVNYVTRRVRIATGNIQNGRETIRATRLPARPLLTIGEVGDGLSFGPDVAIRRTP